MQNLELNLRLIAKVRQLINNLITNQLKEATQSGQNMLDFNALAVLLAQCLTVQTHVTQVAFDLLESQLR